MSFKKIIPCKNGIDKRKYNFNIYIYIYISFNIYSSIKNYKNSKIFEILLDSNLQIKCNDNVFCILATTY